MQYQGGCHCGVVRFEVDVDGPLVVQHCNCSMCAATGFVHLIVSKAQFKLLKGSEAITTYTFNTKVAKHTFCQHCGVKPFYTPRSHPDGYSVNARCFDFVRDQGLENNSKLQWLKTFDGQNWEENIDSIKHL